MKEQRLIDHWRFRFGIFVLIISVLVSVLIYLGYITPETSFFSPTPDTIKENNQINVTIDEQALRNVLAESIYRPLHTKSNYWYDDKNDQVVVSDATLFVIDGTSAEPYVFDGNHLVVKPFNGVDIDNQDIICYNDYDKFYIATCHRVEAVYYHGKEIRAIYVSNKWGGVELVEPEQILYTAVGVLWD